VTRAFVLDGLAVVLALLAAFAPLPRDWIENGYANGFFAALNRSIVPLTNRVPFAVGDLELVVVVLALIAWWVRALRGVPRTRRRRRALALLAHTLGWAAFGVVVFEVLWGFNYRRETVVQRVDYRAARVTDARVRAFSERIVGVLNHDVAAAHRERVDPERLQAAWAPIIARLGDRWDVAITDPKATLLQPYYAAAGIGGQYSPLSFETFLNASFLPFEIPRALAHEWSHAAGFTDEGDANFIGTLTCLRSDDPLIRYSGAFWTYGELPDAERRRLRLDRRVVADFEASRKRFMAGYVPQIFDLQWRFYDSYLRTNGVRGGVASYGYFLRLLVGTALDERGLPMVRSAR
jgi:hypothetical protein